MGESFNQDISNWNTAEVTSMREMFNGASEFDQDISSWNTANVIDMSRMFEDASKFNQCLGNWQKHFRSDYLHVGEMFASSSCEFTEFDTIDTDGGMIWCRDCSSISV